jgi:CRISPR type III-A-associated RAMP protein Csm4
MMAEKVYRLTFNSPLYVGIWGIDRQKTLTYLPSDTLFGALVVAWRMINRLPDDLAGLSLRLTSAFPFAGSVRFFPRPLRYIPLAETVAIKPKELKKIEWVSEEIFHYLRQTVELGQHLGPKNFIQGGTIWLTEAERQQLVADLGLSDDPDAPLKLTLWQEGTVPRVTVDRRDSGSNLFSTGRLKFAEGAGLWFAARGDESERVEAGLTYLKEAGLGGLRSTGHGGFTWKEWKLPPLPEPSPDDGYFISLARFAPTTRPELAPLQAENAAYKLVTVRGWCQDDAGHPWRRKQVRLVAEGAYLGWPGQPPGNLVDVTPTGVGVFDGERKVYRFGLAFPVKAG